MRLGFDERYDARHDGDLHERGNKKLLGREVTEALPLDRRFLQNHLL